MAAGAGGDGERRSGPTEATTVEWRPVQAEELRISRVVDRPLGELGGIIRIRPAELIRLAYGETSGDEAVVRLPLSDRVPWLAVPVRIECWTPSPQPAGDAISLRWRAARLASSFPEMEADLQVRPEGEGRTRLVLDGRYRPPLGLLGLVIDRLVGRYVATAIARHFVEQLARHVERSADNGPSAGAGSSAP
ncbi:MAG TPA: hypothetical protein VKV23_06165 [Acidimicrobiales bacterium]|nr:hypothetical protein [Acidimicrobiales bacterium]